MNKFPLYNYKSIKKLSKFLQFQDKQSFTSFIKQLDTNSQSFYKIYTLKNKKNRTVFECTPFMKRIHSKLKDCFNKIDTPEYLYSGVKRKSYITNAKYHINSKSFYIVDISKFYPSITKEKIYKSLVSSFNQSHNVANAISNIITIEYQNKRFLVTGSPLSQIVAYFINKPMFDKIKKISDKYEITFSVYVDDLTFSSKKNIPSKFKFEIQSIIEYYNYSYSTEKIQSKTIHRKTEKFPTITGVSIQNDSVLDLPEDRKEDFQDAINEFLSLTASNIDDFFKNLDKLNGLIIEANQINGQKYANEKSKVEAFVKTFLTNNKQQTKNYIIKKFEILKEIIDLKTIDNFAKRYINSITKTTRLLNIISNKSFTEEIHNIINADYLYFSSINKYKLGIIQDNPQNNPLINKILLDFKKQRIY